MTEKDSLIKINAKTPTQTYSVEVSGNATVSQVKDQLLTQLQNATKERLCIIYTGKILKDEETLSQHKIADGHTVHLVIRTAARTNPAPTTTSTPESVAQQPQSIFAQTPNSNPSAGSNRLPQNPDVMNNPDMMRQMMDNPIVQNMMSNPELMRSVISSNPQFQQLIERNPEVGHMLNDPNVMRQTMEMIRNPNMFQEMMRNHDIAIRNLQGIPGGQAALERLYNDVQEPLLNSASNTMGGNPFAALRENQPNEPRSDRAGQENSDALPNPWAAPRSEAAQDSNNQQQSNNPMQGMLNSPGMSSLMQQMMSDPSVSSSLFNPQMMQMMRQTLQSNPQLIDTIIDSNPTAQSNPGISDMMRERLPEMLDMMSNPEVLQAVQNPRVAEAFQQIQQGFNTLRTEAPQLMGMFGSMGAPRNSGNNAASNMSANNLSQLFAGMGMGGAGIPRAPAGGAAANPEQQYAAQLEQLQSMGFSNRAANIAALTASFGDLNAAVERLLNSPR